MMRNLCNSQTKTFLGVRRDPSVSCYSEKGEKLTGLDTLIGESEPTHVDNKLEPYSAYISLARSYLAQLRNCGKQREAGVEGKPKPASTPHSHHDPKPAGGERRRKRRRKLRQEDHGVVVDPVGRPRHAEGPRGPGQRTQQDPERHLQEPPGPQAVHHPGRRERARPQGARAA